MGQKSLRILLTSFQTIFSAEVMPHIKENEEKKKPFIRKGQVGDWKNYFDQESSLEWDQWIQSTLQGTGMVMKFE